MPFERIAAERPPLADNPPDRIGFGRLVVSAVPRFYGLVPIADDELARAVGDTIGKEGGELENAAGRWASSHPAAIVTWLPLSHLQAAQRTGSIELMRHVGRAETGDFLRGVGAYARTVEPIEGTGLYLSRVAVADELRGRGLGREAVAEVIAAAAGEDVWLHVAADNASAIKMYEAMGFQFASSAAFESRAMRLAGSR